MSSLNFSNFISNLDVTSQPTTGYDLIAMSSDASSSGFLYLGNLLIQWGTTKNYNSGTGHNIDLNVSYDNASDYTVIGVPGSGSEQDGTGITIVNDNNTSSYFKLRVWGSGQVGVNWIAIGKKPSGYPTS